MKEQIITRLNIKKSGAQKLEKNHIIRAYKLIDGHFQKTNSDY